jgi:hypothetical protein
MKEDISPAAPTTAPNTSLGIKAGPIQIGKPNKDKNGKTSQGSQRPPMDTQIIMASYEGEGSIVEMSDTHTHHPDWLALAHQRGASKFKYHKLSHRTTAETREGKIVGVWNHKHREGYIPEEHMDSVTETLGSSATAGEWIHDFVNSKNSKFAGKSKKERIKMALGAYYHKEQVNEGAEEHKKFADHTTNPYHKTLAAHGFVHQVTAHKQNPLAPKTPEGKHDYTEHVYKHPAHGKSHVIVTQYHTPGRDHPHYFLHRHEQSNGIMAPASGENKNHLHRSLSYHYGVPKGMEAPKLTAHEKRMPEHLRHTYKMNEAIGHIEKGAFHKWLGKSEDEPITHADIEKGLKAGGHAAKMANFARNMAESVSGATRMDIQKTLSSMRLAGYTHNAAIHHTEKAHNVHSIQLNSKGDVINFKHMHESMNEARMPLKGHPYHEKSDAELHYIIKDAGEASKLHDQMHKGVGAYNKYADQVNDAATILHHRKTSKSKPKAKPFRDAAVTGKARDFNNESVITSMDDLAPIFEAHNDTNPIIKDRFGNSTGRTSVSDAIRKKLAGKTARAAKRDTSWQDKYAGTTPQGGFAAKEQSMHKEEFVTENYADWHEQMEKRGKEGSEVAFRIKNAGGRTEAHHNGKKIGHYDHTTRKGHMSEAIHNANSSGQGHDPEHQNHPLHSTITKHGYNYSHSTPINRANGTKYISHTYKHGTHNVSTHSDASHTGSQHWSTSTSTSSGHGHNGMGVPELEAHLKSKGRRYGLKKNNPVHEEVNEGHPHKTFPNAHFVHGRNEHGERVYWTGKEGGKDFVSKNGDHALRFDSHETAHKHATRLNGQVWSHGVHFTVLSPGHIKEDVLFEKSKSQTEMKRKYLGKTRGTTATGKPAHEVVVDPIIKVDPRAGRGRQNLPAPDRGI